MRDEGLVRPTYVEGQIENLHEEMEKPQLMIAVAVDRVVLTALEGLDWIPCVAEKIEAEGPEASRISGRFLRWSLHQSADGKDSRLPLP